MDVFRVVKFILILAIVDLSSGNKNCKDEFFKRNYITNFADGLKYTNLEVRYDDHKVECGEVVPCIKTTEAPIVKFDVTGKCKNVTVLVIGPDAFKNSSYPMWLAVNVPSSALKEGFANGGQITDKLEGHQQGNVIAQYVIPFDPTAGVRRFTLVYFVYCQCHYNSDLRLFTRIDRVNFNVKQYARDHGLKCPVTGIFHQMSFTGLPTPELVQEPPLPHPPEVPNPKLPLPAQ